MILRSFPFSSYLAGAKNNPASWRFRVFDEAGHVNLRLVDLTIRAVTLGFMGYVYNGSDKNDILNKAIALRLHKSSGVDEADDAYFGAPVTREVPIDFPVQGANQAEIVSIGFSDQTPRPALWKPADGEDSGLVSAIGGPQYVREEAAWLLDRELNEPDSFLVPVAYVSQIDGQDGAALHYVTGREAAQSVSEYGADWIERAGVLDYILGQTDRHAGNWLTHPDEDDRPILIDNGLSFPATSAGLNSPFVEAARGRTLSSDMQLSLKSVVGNKALWQDIAGLVGKDAASAAWERANQLQQEGAIPSA